MAVEEKQRRLLAILGEYGRVAVAFSGGVDSAVVCKAAALSGADNIAVTATSPSVAKGELEEAEQLAKLIGIRHVVLQTNEFADSNYTSNPTDRCRYCKTELYSQIAAKQIDLQFDAIANGANTDDLGDYRPGLQAATEFYVHSPLVEAGINKLDVRELAKNWSLPVWDKPATPCLSSRVAYGVTVTPERLRRIDEAEIYLKSLLQIQELRVRCIENDVARIEVPLAALPALQSNENAVGSRLRSLGFQSVTIDERGFRSGSMNENLPLVSLQLSVQKESPTK